MLELKKEKEGKNMQIQMYMFYPLMLSILLLWEEKEKHYICINPLEEKKTV